MTAGAAAALALFLTGCGGDGAAPDSSTPAPTVPPSTADASATQTSATEVLSDIDGCITPADATLLVHEGPDTIAHVALLGEGSVGVVISYDAARSVCQWLPLADRLVEAGHRALLYEAVQGSGQAHITAMAGLLRDQGAEHVFLLGGDKNGSASIVAATTIEPAVAGVVSLSGPVTEAAASLTVPMLQIVAEQDGPVPAGARANDAAATQAPSSDVLSYPGEAHASTLIDPSYASSEDVLTAIVAFVDAQTA